MKTECWSYGKSKRGWEKAHRAFDLLARVRGVEVRMAGLGTVCAYWEPRPKTRTLSLLLREAIRQKHAELNKLLVHSVQTRRRS